MNSEALQERGGKSPAELMKHNESMSPYRMAIVLAESGMTTETLEKMMDLQKRYEDEQAKKAFTCAMAAFKSDAPAVLNKDGEVKFSQTHYRHATLGGVIKQITPALSRNGLSVSWDTEQLADTSKEGSSIRVTCHVTHIQGHRESVSLIGAPDNSGNKNKIQQVGSAVTYLQRYTLLAVLGLATAEDADGNPVPLDQEEAARRVSAAGASAAAPVTAKQPPPIDYTVCPIGGEGFKGVPWRDMDDETLAGALACEDKALTHTHKAAIRLVIEQRKEAAEEKRQRQGEAFFNDK